MLSNLSIWYNQHYQNTSPLRLTLVLGFLFIFVYLFGAMLTPVFVALILAYLLKLPLRYMMRQGCSEVLALSLVFALFLGGTVWVMLTVIPVLMDELVQLIHMMPHILDKLHMMVAGFSDLADAYLTNDQINVFFHQAQMYITHVGKFAVLTLLNAVPDVIAVLVYCVLVPLLVFYFLKDRQKLTLYLKRFKPEETPLLDKSWCRIERSLACYVRGKAVEMVVMTLLSLGLFFSLGLRYELLLSVLVGVSVLIPIVGVVLVSMPLTMVGLWQWGFSQEFLVLMGLFFLLIALDANLLVPILFSEAMGVHPIAIIVALLFFGQLFGVWGVFLAIPMVKVLHIVLSVWLSEYDAAS